MSQHQHNKPPHASKTPHAAKRRNIGADTIRRLRHDIRHIAQNPLTDSGVYYCHDDTELLRGYALIVGPIDTPYYGGFYFFRIEYTANYPFEPPKVVSCTNQANIRFHPNLYTSGKVCLSILNTWEGEPWTPCQNITSILLSICSLFTADPLLNEPGMTVAEDAAHIATYNRVIEYANLEAAMCNIVERHPGIHQPFFDLFRSEIDTHVRRNLPQLLEKCRANAAAMAAEVVSMSTYRFKVTVDYGELIGRLLGLQAGYITAENVAAISNAPAATTATEPTTKNDENVVEVYQTSDIQPTTDDGSPDLDGNI